MTAGHRTTPPIDLRQSGSGLLEPILSRLSEKVWVELHQGPSGATDPEKPWVATDPGWEERRDETVSSKVASSRLLRRHFQGRSCRCHWRHDRAAQHPPDLCSLRRVYRDVLFNWRPNWGALQPGFNSARNPHMQNIR